MIENIICCFSNNYLQYKYIFCKINEYSIPDNEFLGRIYPNIHLPVVTFLFLVTALPAGNFVCQRNWGTKSTHINYLCGLRIDIEEYAHYLGSLYLYGMMDIKEE